MNLNNPQIIEAVKLDSFGASGADIVQTMDQLSITGQGIPIDLKRARFFKYEAYSAGVPKDVTITISGVAISTYYTFYITKQAIPAPGITTTAQKYQGVEKYVVYSGDTGTPANNVATNLAAKVTATITAGVSPFDGATASTASVAFTAADANFDYIITSPDATVVSVVDVDLTEAAGTATVVNRILNQFGKSATAGISYATYIWVWDAPLDGTAPQLPTANYSTVATVWFVNKDDGDFASFDATVSDIQDGTTWVPGVPNT